MTTIIIMMFLIGNFTVIVIYDHLLLLIVTLNREQNPNCV